MLESSKHRMSISLTAAIPMCLNGYSVKMIAILCFNRGFQVGNKYRNGHIVGIIAVMVSPLETNATCSQMPEHCGKEVLRDLSNHSSDTRFS